MKDYMSIAHQELSHWPDHLADYYSTAGVNYGDDWCSAFAIWVMEKAGYPVRRQGVDGGARSWVAWGKHGHGRLVTPRPHAICVLWDDNYHDARIPGNPWLHVAFLAGWHTIGSKPVRRIRDPKAGVDVFTDLVVQLLGGNQGGAVNLTSYYLSKSPPTGGYHGYSRKPGAAFVMP